MKQEWWKKKLREDAELRFPDHEKNGNSRSRYSAIKQIKFTLQIAFDE